MTDEITYKNYITKMNFKTKITLLTTLSLQEEEIT